MSKIKEWLSTFKIGAPLALSVFGFYAIHRGLSTFCRTDMVPEFFSQSLSLFMFTTAIASLLCGPLLDKVNTRKVLLWSVALGIIGLLSLQFGPWGFAILFGVGSTLMRLAVFSSPMKLFDKKESWHIAPQASAKNFGSAFFILFFGAVALGLGWGVFSIILSVFLAITGLYAYHILPNDRVVGWSYKIFPKLARDWKFWAMAVFYVACGLSGYYYFSHAIPSMLKSGIAIGTAITILATSFIFSGFCRWFAAWLGHKIGHIITMCIALGMVILSAFTVAHAPVFIVYFAAVGLALMTPNYWPAMKQIWGPANIATLGAFCYFFMALGAGTALWR